MASKIKNKQLLVNSDFDVNTHKIINVVDPTENQDVSTKLYTDTKLSLSGGTITGSLNVQGDLYISGTTVTVHAEEILVEDNTITINYGEPGSGVTRGYAGIVVDRGFLTDYEFVFNEDSDTFRIGQTGDTQAVATREDTPIDGGFAIWDSGLSMFITQESPTYIVSLSTEISTEISNRTSSDESLTTAISSVSGATIDIDGVMDDGELLGIIGGELTGVSYSTVVSSEASKRISADESLSTAIGSGDSGLLSLSTIISTETSNRTVDDTSLSTAISTETSNRTVDDTSLTTAISTEVSTRSSADTSLSTAISVMSGDTLGLGTIMSEGQVLGVISGELTGVSYSVINLSLSTVISNETSSRISESYTYLKLTGGTINGDLNIFGNLFVSGTTISLETEEILVEDNLVVINNGEPGSGVTRGIAGFVIDRGFFTDYEFIFNESDDTFRIGQSGSTQAVATREDTPIDGGYAVWDTATNMFITVTGSTDLSSLSTAISTEVSDRVSGDESLSTAISVMSGDTTDITTLLTEGQVLGMISGLIVGVDYSTIVSTEASDRIVADESLATAIGSISPATALSGLTDVSVSSVQDNDVLVWISADQLWENRDSFNSLSTVISGELSSSMDSLSVAISGNISSSNDSLSSAISSNISSGNDSLSTAISINISTADSSLSTLISESFSTEISNRTSADESLASAIGTGGPVALSGLTDVNISGANYGDVLTYANGYWFNTTISTALSTEISTFNSVDESLSTAISTTNESLSISISERTSVDESLSTVNDSLSTAISTTNDSLSTAISERTSVDESLSTVNDSLSTAISTTNDSLSTSISERTSVDESLSTVNDSLSTAISTTNDSLSTAISERTSVDESLSTAIGSISPSAALSGLTDVSISSIGDNNILVWIEADQLWENRDSLSGFTSLSTAIDSLNLSDLNDIGLDNPTISDILMYNPTSTGLWHNVPIGSIGGASSLSGLTDVSLSTVIDNDVLTFSGTTWVNRPNLWIESNSAVTLSNENYNLKLNTLEMDTDGGALTFVDMPVTSGATSDTEESYSLNIDGNSVVRVYSESDGTGGVKNTGLVLDGDYFYAGNPTTNGSWRWFVNVDGDLEFQKLTGGTWTYKSKFT